VPSDEEIKRQQEELAIAKELTAELQKEAELNQQKLDTFNQFEEALRKTKQFREVEAAALESINSLNSEAFEKVVEQNKEFLKGQDFAEHGVELLREKIRLSIELKDVGGLVADEEEKVADATEQATANKEAFNKAAAEAAKLVGEVASAVGGLATGLSGISQLPLMSAGVGGMASVFTQAATSIQGTNVELARQTGFASKLTPVVNKLVAEGGDLGLSFGDGARIIGELNSSFRDLAAQSPATIDKLARTAAELSTLGVNAQDTGQALMTLTRSMGMTADQGDEVLKGFKSLAQDVGLPTGQVVQDFNLIAPKLAKFGKDATKEFTQLTKQARSLGVSTADIFNFGEQMDTFEGAADLAGKLNAQFRLQLNSTELLGMSEAERLETIRNEFREKKNISELGKFERKALAEMLGMSEDQALRIMGNATAFSAYAEDVAATEDRQAKFTKTSDALASSFERAVISLQPLLSGLMGLAEVIASIAGNPFVAYTLMATAGLVGLTRTVLFAVNAINFFRTAGAGAIVMLKLKEFFGFKAAAASTAEASADTAAAGAEGAKTAATGAGIAVQQTANAVAAAGVGPMLALGGAIALIGVGVGAAAFGMAYLVESFGALSGEQILGAVTAIGLLGVGFYFLVPAVAAAGAVAAGASGPLMALGFAVLMMGAGVGVAAYGFSLLVKSFKGLSADQATAAAASIVAVSVSIGSLVAAMFFGGSAAVAGIIGLGVGMTILGVALTYATPLFTTFVKGISMIEADKIYKIATSIGILAVSIGALTFGLGVMFAALANPIAGIAGLIAIGTLAAMLFTLGEAAAGIAEAAGGIEPLEKLVTVTTQATPAQLENLSQVIDQIVRVTSETNTQGVVATSNLAQAVQGAMGPATAGGGNKTVILKVNRDVLGQVVTNWQQDEYGVEIR